MAESAPQRTRAATSFILVTIVLDVLALGIVIPVLPRLVQSFAHEDAARAARIYGLFGTAWALMQFLFSPVLGAISDRFGRRRVLLISCFGLGLDYILMALAPTLTWLFIGRVISGITAASFSTAYAYIADTTKPEQRAASFGLVGAAWGLGFVLGPALGGLAGAVNPRLPFWVAAALALLSSAYGLLVLPESLPPEKRKPFSFQRANPVGALRLLTSRPRLLGLSSVQVLYHLAHHVLPSMFVLYAGHRYGWREREVGLGLAAMGVCNALVQGALVKRAVARLREPRTLMLGLLFGSMGLAVYGLAPTAPWLFLGVVLYGLTGLFTPALQGLMTRQVSPAEQGQLQGASSSLMGIVGLFAPGLFTQTFAYAVGAGYTPGAPFLLGSALMLVALMAAARVTREPASPPSPLAV